MVNAVFFVPGTDESDEEDQEASLVEIDEAEAKANAADRQSDSLLLDYTLHIHGLC